MNKYPFSDRSERGSANSIYFGALALGAVAIIDLGLGMVADATYGQEAAQTYLEQQGYTSVADTGMNMLAVWLTGCGSTDLVQYSFSTTAPNGQVDVPVIVCKGILSRPVVRQG